MENKVNIQEIACEAHAKVNHLYGGNQPYSVHLKEVARLGALFSLGMSQTVANDLIDACWLHDVLEDCRWNYQQIKQITNERVAEIVYAVTDELGRNRQERKTRTLPKIAAYRPAVFVKLCDRIANTEYSLNTAKDSTKSANMYAKYCQEYPAFRAALHVSSEYPLLWARADKAHNFNK